MIDDDEYLVTLLTVLSAVGTANGCDDDDGGGSISSSITVV